MRRILVLIYNILCMPMRLFTHVSPLCIIQEAHVDKKAAICSGVRFYRSRIGKYSYIGNNSFVTDTDIGKFTSISTDCYIGGTMHPTKWVSTSPVFHKWENILKTNFSQFEFEIFNRTTIGSDVWIGNRVMIKAGIKIGNGAVIGMGSIVTKDVGSYEVWAGNPAKKIGDRMDEAMKKKIADTEWWDWEDSKIQRMAKYFNDPVVFLEATNQ